MAAESRCRPDEGDGLIDIQGYDRNLSSLFDLVSHTDIRLIAVQVPVKFVSALTLMFLSNTPLSRIPSKDSVKEN